MRRIALVLGVLLGVAWYLTGVVDAAPTLRALFGYLCLINLVLAAFNSLPAFPLDGGRVLRSLLWGITGDLRIATRVAVGIGSAFGLGLVFLGVVFVFMVPGGVVSGVWFIVIGFFVRYAATSSLRMATMRHHLEGEQIRRFMSETVVTVPDEMPLSDFVEQFVFRHRYAYYPVVDAMGRLVGIMSARGPGSVERDRWPSTPVRDVMTPLDSVLVLPPEADAVEALMALRSAEASRVVVAEHGRPVGVVSLRDLLGFLALKIDLDAAHVT